MAFFSPEEVKRRETNKEASFSQIVSLKAHRISFCLFTIVLKWIDSRPFFRSFAFDISCVSSILLPNDRTV